MRFLHTADLHLARRQYGSPQREKDFYNVLLMLTEVAVRFNVEAVVLAGDTYDFAKLEGAAVRPLQAFVTKLKQHGITVIGIDGNHDRSNGEWLKLCGAEYVGDGSGVLVGGIRFCGIDNCTLDQFRAKVADIAEGGTADVLIVHQAVAELAGFNGAEFVAADIVDAAKKLKTVYVALGDIHTPREAVFDGIRMAYPGSPETTSEDLTGYRGCTVVDIDPANKAAVSTIAVPLPVRPFIRMDFASEDPVGWLVEALAVTPGEPVVIGWFTPAQRETARAAEKLLRERNLVYRLLPCASEALIKTAENAIDRGRGLIRVESAAELYFTRDTDEFQLIIQLLNNPGNAKKIAQEYCVSKGVPV